MMWEGCAVARCTAKYKVISSVIALCAAGTVILGILPTAVNLAQNVVVPALIR
jgi:hypothetical protein